MSWPRWRPIATLPKEGQVLVTADDLNEEGGYGEIELVVCPMLEDGRILNQNSGNYTLPNTWRWWIPIPPKDSQ